MHRLFQLLILMFVAGAMFPSCRKNKSGDPVASRPLLDSLIHQFQNSNGEIETVSYNFLYDAGNNLVEVTQVELAVPVIRITYTSGEVSGIRIFSINGILFQEYTSPQTLAVTDKEINFFSTHENTYAGTIDTTRQVFTIEDSVLVRSSVFQQSSDPRFIEHGSIVYRYNVNDNLAECGYEGSQTTYGAQWISESFDNNKNPFRYLSPMLFDVLQITDGFSMGMNNITSYRYFDGIRVDLEYTYNAEGWPLSVKETTKSFVMYQFAYK